ncbi:MAG: phage Gp37/Gp68 family protein [Firmicutes bacterium]|nr:phage Gp37/Gp68 family protein [[Eubacterium] siraeum]MCM1487120.1 phage Gp37/Gp68 family protein [Bacillota bacterium]
MLWNPWHGCHKCSSGCKNCYVYYLDKLRDKDSSVVTKSKTGFDLPLKKDRRGNYKILSGTELGTCFTSDFFIEEADGWRQEAWKMIRQRSDVKFLIPTKRISRFEECKPSDWGDSGYPNVAIAVSCENQAMADERLPYLLNLKAHKKLIFASPILEYIDFGKFLSEGEISLVSVGGESYANARVCDFEWVAQIWRDCLKYGVDFDFHQTGSNFLKDGRLYRIKHCDEYSQAKKGMEYLKLHSPNF